MAAKTNTKANQGKTTAAKTESGRCQATTNAGAQCKNRAQKGSKFCHVHQQDKSSSSSAKSAAAKASSEVQAQSADGDAQLELLLDELNALAHELQRRVPDFKPPQFSPSALLDLIGKNIDRIVPEEQRGLFDDLRRNLRGTTAKDLVDPETWKGLWYVLNYSLQMQSASMVERLTARLGSIPGMEVLTQLKGNLEGASPRDLLDPDTWKGFWYIVGHTAQLELQQARDRLMGKSSQEQ
jgi:hypothetical protein